MSGDAVNHFSFTCPIFNVETKMSACMQLREQVWMGRKPEVRRGCQACMRASKCPVVKIVQKISYDKSYDGMEYFSATPVRGRIGRSVLQHILPTVVPFHLIDQSGASDVERRLIASAEERIVQQLSSAPKDDQVRSRRTIKSSDGNAPRKLVSRSTAKPKSSEPKVSNAAATGDLSAAINQE